MPVVLLPGTDEPKIMPPRRLKEVLDRGERIVLPDYDVAMYKRGDAYVVIPIDNDVGDGGVIAPEDLPSLPGDGPNPPFHGALFHYDESTNPSNGWCCPATGDDSARDGDGDEFREFEEALNAAIGD